MARIIIGLKWKCSPGAKKPCPACARLDGQEFFYQPQGSQRPVEDMPEPPLHPNCGCTRVPIYKYGELSKYFGKDGRMIRPGVAIGSDGLPSEDLGQYGNYGGPHWTEGRNEANLRGDEERPKPIDAMDECFMHHDDRYTMCALMDMGDVKAHDACTNQADRNLVKELLSLPSDCEEWGGQPKLDNEKFWAKAYRFSAIVLFMGKTVAYYKKTGAIF